MLPPEDDGMAGIVTAEPTSEVSLPRALRIGAASVDALLEEVDADLLAGHEVVEVGLAVLSPAGENGQDRATEVVDHFGRLGFVRLARTEWPHCWGPFGVLRWDFVRGVIESVPLDKESAIAVLREAWLAREIVAFQPVEAGYLVIRPQVRTQHAIALAERAFVGRAEDADIALSALMEKGTPRQLRVLFADSGLDESTMNRVYGAVDLSGYEALHGCELHAAEGWIDGYICTWVTSSAQAVDDVSKSDASLASVRLWTLGYSNGISFSGFTHSLRVDDSALRAHVDELSLEALRRGTLWIAEPPR